MAKKCAHHLVTLAVPSVTSVHFKVKIFNVWSKWFDWCIRNGRNAPRAKQIKSDLSDFSASEWCHQCDHIGPVLKALGNKVSCKRSLTDWQHFLGLFWKTSRLCKNCIGYFFGQLLEKIGLHFTPTSGHTGCVASRLLGSSGWNVSIYCRLKLKDCCSYAHGMCT